MKTIAVTANDDRGLAGEMSMHFGHCSHFVLATLDDNSQVKATDVRANPYAEQHQPGQIPDFIKSLGANVVLSGGMGGRAIEFFDQLGIEVATGHRPNVGAAIEAYVAGELNGAAGCAHDHEH
ncbi:NifB/NifX family molybdenum-iron cluster-binding protein [Rhabdochromatium marinum]|uniref:NifB/NifX family molybdenum-iron cluster-binding protein n=1 Tax=Rhabdochromatium marinum TaxID=48729 RepID=UPI0019051EE3|nr:NifB/NifX family molybdenum-iron cluster-binding protein [Rhabdochromatium marinum]MBK1650159.1 dinitrogenase iron-molybdenum cofactor biosynthesis protein [Rhabdochromatium marinum]